MQSVDQELSTASGTHDPSSFPSHGHRRRLFGKLDWHALAFLVSGLGTITPLSWVMGYLTLTAIDPAVEYAVTIGFSAIFVINVGLIARREARKTRLDAPNGGRLPRSKLAITFGMVMLAFVLASGIVANKLSFLNSTMREGPADIRLIPGRPEMEINGTFAFGLTDRVRLFLDEYPQVRTVYLTSRGGVGVEAVALADLIRERNLSTYVPLTCLSACTAAFSAGRERWLKDGARLGYHSGGFRIPFIPVDLLSRVFGSSMRNAYLRAGMTPEFVDRALSTPFAGMWHPSVAELIAANAITGVVDRYRFALAGSRRHAGFFSLGKGYWRMTSVTTGLPKEREAFDDIISSGYDAGMSEGEIGQRVFRRAAAIMRRRIARSEDAAVLEAGHILYAAMASLNGNDDAACTAIGTHADLGAAGDALTEQAFDVTRMVIDLVGRRAIGATQPTHSLSSADDGNNPPIRHPVASCAEVMVPYAEALTLGGAEAAARLRALFTGNLDDRHHETSR